MKRPKMKISARMCRNVFKYADKLLKDYGQIRLNWIIKDFGYDPFILLRVRDSRYEDFYSKLPVWYNINDFGEVFAKCFEVDPELDERVEEECACCRFNAKGPNDWTIVSRISIY